MGQTRGGIGDEISRHIGPRIDPHRIQHLQRPRFRPVHPVAQAGKRHDIPRPDRDLRPRQGKPRAVLPDPRLGQPAFGQRPRLRRCQQQRQVVLRHGGRAVIGEDGLGGADVEIALCLDKTHPH